MSKLENLDKDTSCIVCLNQNVSSVSFYDFLMCLYWKQLETSTVGS